MTFPDFLRVAVLTVRHIIEVNTTDDGNILFTGGVEANFIDALAFALRFTYKVVIPEDGEWGRVTNDGHWTGMVGMVYRNEADIAIGHLTITPKRLKAVDFIPYTVEENTFASKLPGTLPRAGSYLQPLHTHVWLICLTTVILMPFLYRFLMKKKLPIQKLLLGMFGCFLNQPISFILSTGSDRLLIGSWFIFAMILSTSYNAVLLSSLTVPVYENGVKNIKELADSVSKGKYKVLASKGSADIELLTESKDENLRIIGKNLIETEWRSETKSVVAPSDIEEFTAILGPKFFYILEYGAEPFTNKYIFKESVGTWNVGLAVRKDFCCKREIYKYVSRIMNSGIFGKFYDDQVSKSRLYFEEINDRVSHHGALTINDLLGAFILILVGYAISLVVWAVEYKLFGMCHKRRKKRVHFSWI